MRFIGAALLWGFGLVAHAGQVGDLPRFRWENFTAAQGLPDNRVYSVCVDGDRVWAGTDNVTARDFLPLRRSLFSN